ncbi:unnamed protein product, partial [Mesorhabditis belari]|uniref:Uncharacterized protein n=1 Tax=Mesorhabditis belari TaxID=2138241 RepID=A0AAF3FS90_9BILA
MEWWAWLFFLIGCLSTLFVIHKTLKFMLSIVWPFFLGPRIDLRRRAGADWAVITGATDGIGQAYAFALAEKGFKLFLVSRTEERLEATKEKIVQKHKVEIRTFTFDFTAETLEEYMPLLRALESLEVGILVNNVGMSYDYPDKLHKIFGGISKVHAMLHINIHPPTLLCMAVLPQMITRMSGVVINIGSASANHTMALWGAYSAAKKYVEWLTKILQKEYKSYGVTIQCVTPMKVATKASHAEKSLIAPDPKSFVAYALRSVGLATITTGHPGHQLQSLIFSMPDWFLDFFIGATSRNMQEEGMKRISQHRN